MSAAGVDISMRALGKRFGDTRVIEGLDLEVNAGEMLAVLGPSGCGKSSLLRMIAGLDTHSNGELLVEGNALTGSQHPLRDAMAFVFQDHSLLPWRNIVNNVALPLELKRVTKAERQQRAMHELEKVGLADAAKQYPAQLSGGMKMRASLARALVTQPRLLLLDEPFAALDELTRQKLDEQLFELWASAKMTVLFVTHSVGEAVMLAQRAVVMNAHPAKIIGDVPLLETMQRNVQLRTTVEFAQKMRLIQDLLQQTEVSHA